jgi:hypothetical protein
MLDLRWRGRSFRLARTSDDERSDQDPDGRPPLTRRVLGKERELARG